MASALQLLQSTDSANEINAGIRLRILDSKQGLQHQILQQCHIQSIHRILTAKLRLNGIEIPGLAQIHGELALLLWMNGFRRTHYKVRHLFDFCHQFFRRIAIQITNHTVVIQNLQLIIREQHG